MDTILQMGFAEYQAKKALAECGDNPEAAINYIMVSLASLAAPRFDPAPVRRCIRSANLFSSPKRLVH